MAPQAPGTQDGRPEITGAHVSCAAGPNPLVSVILPVYNGARFIRDAVDSLTNQTYHSLEIIIVNDGSSDQTKSILDTYSSKHPRIKPIHTENQGLVAALNLAIANASGDFIARMDADDICTPDRIEQQVAHMIKNGACVAVGSNIVRIDADGKRLQKQSTERTDVHLPDRCQQFRRFPPAPPMLVHPSAMMRATTLRQVGGYRAPFKNGAEDRDLWWRLSALGNIQCLPERLLQYRVHEANRSHVLRDGALADALVSDLSAICCFHDLDHDEILGDYEKNRDLPVTIEQFGVLLGARYPVWALHAYRILRRRAKTLIGTTSMARFRVEALCKALSNLSSRPSWYVLSTIAR